MRGKRRDKTCKYEYIGIEGGKVTERDNKNRKAKIEMQETEKVRNKKRVEMVRVSQRGNHKIKNIYTF